MGNQLTVTADAEPTFRSFADLAEGDRCEELLRLSEDMLDAFIGLSGDRAPVHVDRDHARQMGFSDRIAQGLLVTSRFSRLLGMFLPGPLSVIQSIKFDYLKPVLVGQELAYSVTVKRLSAAA